MPHPTTWAVPGVTMFSGTPSSLHSGCLLKGGCHHSLWMAEHLQMGGQKAPVCGCVIGCEAAGHLRCYRAVTPTHGLPVKAGLTLCGAVPTPEFFTSVWSHFTSVPPHMPVCVQTPRCFLRKHLVQINQKVFRGAGTQRPT